MKKYKNWKITSGHMFSFVKFNFNASLFSCNFYYSTFSFTRVSALNKPEKLNENTIRDEGRP